VNAFGHVPGRAWGFPVVSPPIEPGARTSFFCALQGEASPHAYAHLWVAPQTRRSFLVGGACRRADHLRVPLSCVAERPTAFRGWLYVFVLHPETRRERLS
jgi:hypothetical protein